MQSNVARACYRRSRHRGRWFVLAVDLAARAWASSRRRFIQRGGFTFYAPVTTGILVSVILSLILWLMPLSRPFTEKSSHMIEFID
jgi:hypothetical protein